MCLKRFLFILGTATLFTVFFSALAFATVPATSISLNPTVPDGYNGWYLTTPTITLTSNQGGSTTKYQWDVIPNTILGEGQTYTSPFLALRDDAPPAPSDDPEVHVLYYYSYVGSETEELRFFLVKTDPSQEAPVISGTCEGCHANKADFLNPLGATPGSAGSGHDTQETDPCQRCHAAQMSGAGEYPFRPFLRDDVTKYPPDLDPDYFVQSEASPLDVYANENNFCAGTNSDTGCHWTGFSGSAYPGMNLFVQTKHWGVGSSGKALTRWPDENFNYGACGDCHDPHGRDFSDYRNASKNELCLKCHDYNGAPPKPSGYNYRGQTAYTLAEHSISPNTIWSNSLDTGGAVAAGGATAGECINCHNPHGKDAGGGLPISKLTMAGEENLCYGSGTGCHTNAANSENGLNIFERLSYYPLASIAQSPAPIYTGLYTGHHDMTDTDQIAAGSKLECKNCHNPHLDNRSNKVVDPDNAAATYTTTTPANPFGYSTVLIKGTAVTEDTKIKLNSSTNQENSPDAYAWVGRDSSNQIWRALIKFNLSSIPPGLTIDQATLMLAPVQKYEDVSIDVNRLIESWTESGATWFKRDGVNNWSTAGGSFVGPTLDPSKNSVAANMYYGAENLDVTNLVSGWYYNTYPNYGMILVAPAAEINTYPRRNRAYYQSEASGANTKFVPTLVVRYYSTTPSPVLDMARFCEKCHDGTPPGGVITPLNLKTITQAYFDPLFGEYHGERVSEGTYYYGNEGSTLKPPYYAGMPPLPCTECHESHGTSNLYHLKESINGQTVTVTNTTPQAIRTLCQACHQFGTTSHGLSDVQTCFNCHYHRGGLPANLYARDAF